MPRPVKCRKVCHFPNVLEFLPADDTEKKDVYKRQRFDEGRMKFSSAYST